MNKPKPLSVEDALKLNRNQMINTHKQYGNSGLVSLMGLLNFDKQYVKAQGVVVWDDNGKEYLDFLGGYGSLNLGHNPPAVLEAMEKVISMPNFLQASLGIMAGALMQTLAAITPGDLQRSFLCNSGAEAVEGGLKTARAATGQKKFIFCEGGFHGKTMGALSVTGRDKYKTPFEPLIPGCISIPFGDLVALEKELSQGDVAAFITEPILGEGGIIIPAQGYLQQAKELCHRYDSLIIVDEIQTGLGRTGKMFACDYDEMTPDILILSKSLGGGIMPLGAFVTTDEIWTKAYGGSKNCLLHTSTFAGNTWASTAGLAAIEYIIKEDLAARAHRLGEYFLTRLKELQEKHALVQEVRGRGLLIGIEFAQVSEGSLHKLTKGAFNKLSQEYFASLVAGELQNRYGIITAYTLNNPNVIRLEPPLVVDEGQIDQVILALDEILSRHKGLLGLTLSTAKNFIGSIFEKR